jgi:hypothetical protein
MLTRPMLFAVLLAVPLSALPRAPRRAPDSKSAVPLIPEARAADSYTIYAMLLPGASGDMITPSQSTHWVISDTTVNITDMNPAIPPDGMLKAPPDNHRAFEEALEDYEARRYERYRLQADDFHPRPSLSFANAQAVRDLRSSASGSDGVVFFSAVYFNAARTAALVYVNDWCANFCAAGQWVYLEKHGREWVRRSGLVSSGA